MRTGSWRSARRTAVAAGVVAVAVLGAGCSGGGGPVDYGTPTPVATSALATMSASDLLTRARIAVLASGSVHVVTHAPVTSSPSPSGASPSGVTVTAPATTPDLTPAAGSASPGAVVNSLSLDLRLHTDGDADGTLVLNGEPIQFARQGGTTYMHADAATWDNLGQSGSGAAVNGRWVKVSANDQFFSFLGQFLDLTGLTTQVVAANGGSPQVIGPRQYDGRPTLAVSVPQSDGAATVYVAADGGPPYLVGVEENISGEPVGLDFSGYGAQPPVAAPPSSNVVVDTAVPGLVS